MARILVVHRDRQARSFLEVRAGANHETQSVDNIARAVKALGTFRPEALITGLNGKKGEALDLLRYMKRNRIGVPVIVVGGAGAGAMQPTLMKLGAAAFVEYPMEQEALDQTIAQVVQNGRAPADEEKPPPISSEEAAANLSDLERKLNGCMVCFAGKNQVYLQSFVLGGGKTTKPRIAIKCPLRTKYGHPPNVYYEYVRDVCCKNPSACPAYETFTTRHPTT